MNFKKIITKKLGISLSIIIVFLILILFLQGDIAKRADDIVIKKQQIDMNSTNIGLLASLKTDSETAKKYLPQISTYLINKDQLLNFSNDVNLISKQNNLNALITFGDETPASGSNPRSTAISLSSQSQANMTNLINFLKLLENSKYFTRLESVDAIQDGSQLKVSAMGKVFSF